MTGKNGIEQNTLNSPDKDFGNNQGNEVMPEKKIQTDPQKGLSEDVYANTGK